MMSINSRPRRNRLNSSIRGLISENKVTVDDLIAPLFVMEGEGQKVEIESMPEQYRYTLDLLLKQLEELVALDIKCIALFPVINEDLKTKDAKESYNPEGLNQRAIKKIKEQFPDLIIMGDIALDPYSSDGHDGIVENGKILNDETLEVLAKMALAQARAGVDIIGPSDMMDHRIQFIRRALDSEGYKDVLIMSYSAKYASAFYGPFRDALDSAPKAGDKKTYQMDFSNKIEAIRELRLDEEEGADIVMVKPALSYMDIIGDFKRNTYLPVAAYNVSGEYAMVMAAAQKGWIDEKSIMIEILTSFKRAGADIILTYFAQKMAKHLKNQ